MMKCKLVSYTADFKLNAVEKANEVGNREAARFFNVDESNIRLWRRNKTNFENCDRHKRADRRGKPHWLITSPLISFRYGTYQANRILGFRSSDAGNGNRHDKNYQRAYSLYGFCSNGPANVRIPHDEMAARESSEMWNRAPREKARNQPKSTKSHEPGGHPGDDDRIGGIKEGAIYCYGSYPNTVNKNTGNYIKIQPATAEDEDKIKKLLVIKKADHYTIEHPTVIKAVIKGLPSSTNVTDIESELKAKGFKVEKIAQLRKFSTKSPLPLFMIQIKRSENAQDIFKLKNLIYLTVEVVLFRRRPGASQCFNCNYFNHTSKNCKMTPRCLKCEGSHKTHDCPKTERLQTLKCINCNENGHLASSRQCPRFPRLKLKKSEETKTINQTRPVTTELSYAKVCSNETEQQMAPRGETPETQNQTPNEKHRKIIQHQIS
ncbi:nucleic-acid-binding protein from transposon X-element [Trichonephila clavipes]|uniref:Nucleic-acid-binding protein from transposon X-element n=1 Tax=Trichonephila clavipes TaxID=2585209 RepID=A0A8X6SLT3_TRICX|nr:nucleic-acid-binding protein from transposon X-element [Trichonephila clavipes]